jgi:uncharacterized membrane protein
METLKTRIRNKIIYGAIALLPVAFFLYVAAQLFGYVKKASEALAPYLSTNAYFGTGVVLFLTIIMLLVICYLFGALVSTQIGALSFDKVQSKLGDIIPGYEIITNLLRGVAGNKMSYPPALISLSAPGTAVLGFVMEDEGDPYLTVFVPSAPVLTAGFVHIVERSRVQLIEGSSMEAANCMGQWGLGLRELRGARVPPLTS